MAGELYIIGRKARKPINSYSGKIVKVRKRGSLATISQILLLISIGSTKNERGNARKERRFRQLTKVTPVLLTGIREGKV